MWVTISVVGIPMEVIIIIIIGIVLLCSICICVCILGQTIMSKKQSNQPQHFITDTINSQTPYNTNQAHERSSWMCAFPNEKPSGGPNVWEPPLLQSSSGLEYTLPANMRKVHSQDDILGLPVYRRKEPPQLPKSANMRKSMSQDDIIGLLSQQNQDEVNKPQESLVPAQMLASYTSQMSDGDYTMPITMNTAQQQQQSQTDDPQMPEYTLPIKKQQRESADENAVKQAEDDEDGYMLPSSMRPEPIGENQPKVNESDVSPPLSESKSAFEGSSLHNSGYRPESIMCDSYMEPVAVMKNETENANREVV